MKKENKTIWTNVLSDDDIAFFTTLMFDFMENKINYFDFVNISEKRGYNIVANTEISSVKKLTIDQYESLINRIKSNIILYSDINYFVLSNDEYDNIIMTIDRPSIEIAADYGDKRAKDIMQGIYKTEYNVLHGKLPSTSISVYAQDDFMYYISNPNEYIENFFNKKMCK